MKTSLPFETGPYLSAACICEKVLVEHDGVKSIIRMVDRLIHTIEGSSPPEEMEPFDYNLTLFIKLKAGRARGVYPIQVHLIKPSGERPTPMQQSVLFEGEEDRGVDIVANMRIKFDMTGVYWFEIYLRDTCLTRIPFRVIYMPQVRQIRGPSEGLPPEKSPNAS